MLSRTIIMAILGFLFLSLPSLSNSGILLEKADTEQFTAVHLVNLQSEDMEEEFMTITKDFNQALKEIGYPDIKYKVWKERSGRDGKYTYFYQTIWPDQATYDKVHSHEKYHKAVEKHGSRYEELVSEDVYNRYVPLN